jgi:MFS family permease
MPRNVWILSGIALAVAVGYGVVNPVLPVFASSFGVDEFAAAAVISAFAGMRLVFAPAVGALTDRLGHRTVLLAGVLIVAASSVGVGLSANYPQMIVFRGLGGVGSAMFSVSAMTVLLASVDAARRGRASALYQGGFLVGAVSGPALGGLFGAISLRAPFFFYAVTLAAAAVVALRLEPVPGVTAPTRAPRRAGGGRFGRGGLGGLGRVGGLGRPGRPERPGAAGGTGGAGGAGAAADAGSSRPLREVFGDRRYQAALLAHFAQGWNTNGARGALIPLFVAATLAADAAQATLWTGMAMSAAAAVQIMVIWPAGWVVDRFGRRLPMVAGAVVAGVAMVALPRSGSLAALTVALAVYAAGAALIGTAPAAAVGDAAGPGATRAIAF